jgi:4-hydroxy-L-threonine phosphate dehydrogenase PdxA
MSLPVIAVTVGDPSGVGPEIAVKAVRDPHVVGACRPVIYGPHAPDELEPFPAGEVSPASARAAYDAIVAATEDARAGRVAGVATGPINKEAFAKAGYPWKGHTDLLAHLCGVPKVAMMFWSDRLRVVLATVHIPLVEGADHRERARDDPAHGSFDAAVRIHGPVAGRRRDQPARRGARPARPRRSGRPGARRLAGA